MRNFSEILRGCLIAAFIFAFPAQPASAVPAQGHQIMYAGPSPYGVEITRDIYKKGGNVVDAAVAVALSLAVTHPYFAAFGGGGFALIKIGKSIEALDFREVAPSKANPKTFNERGSLSSITGGMAVGVPGVPAGLWDLHRKHGRLKWAKLFAPAIELAEKGFYVSGEWAETTIENRDRFSQAGKDRFLHRSREKHVALKPGEIHKQKELAKFLRLFQKDGPRAFYQGAVADDIVRAVNDGGGIFTLEDLKKYRTRWLEPMTMEYNGYTIRLMPPPSSGGVIIAQALRLFDKLGIKDKKPLSADEYHLLVESMKLSFRGRSLLGDPDFNKNPLDRLLSDKYLSEMAALVKLDKAVPVEPLKEIKFENGDTTHFSIMDAKGDAVAFTVTLNGPYGSGVVTRDFGIALNNEMDDFTTELGRPNYFELVQGAANLVRAGARPLSSMSPTIVEKGGATVLVLGAPGGSRIISGVLQVLYRVLQQGFDVDLAIQSPRVHHQFLPDVIMIDEKRLSPEIIESLEKRGHKLRVDFQGRVAAVARDTKGILSGAADLRGEAAAGGF